MISIKTRRILGFFILGLMLAGTLMTAGCSRQAEQEENGSNELSGTLTIAGSTSVQPFSEVLAEKFMEKNKNVQVNVQGGGSSQGVEAAISGAADIGSASRDMKEEEKAKGLIDTKMALDGVAVISHPSNKVSDLTIDQIKNIYLGNIKNWKEVGGNDAAITVVCREDGSGTREAFSNIVMNKEDITNKALIQNSNGAMRTTVAGDNNAIGFVSLAILNNQVKALKIEGVEASEQNVKSEIYKISRPFLYLTKGEPTGLAKAFIDFVLSDEGQKIIVDEGAISIK